MRRETLSYSQLVGNLWEKGKVLQLERSGETVLENLVGKDKHTDNFGKGASM